MDSDYLTPGNLLVFRGTCCIGNGSAAIYCFSFMWTTVFLYFLKGWLGLLFVVHIFILPSLDFVQTFLCIHIAQTKMATYNDGVAIYPNRH